MTDVVGPPQGTGVRRRAGKLRRTVAGRVNDLRGRPDVHLLHIRKTGGSAVKHAFEGRTVSPTHRVHLHEHGFTFGDVPRGQATVFFLRDPAARFVSGFGGRQRQGRPRYDDPWTPDERAAFERFPTAADLARALSSPDASEQRAAEDAMYGIVHLRFGYEDWLGSPGYLESRADDVLFVGFQESLDRDFAVLASTLGFSGLELPRDDVASHRSPAGAAPPLDEEGLANIRRWYATDYDILEVARRLSVERAPGD